MRPLHSPPAFGCAALRSESLANGNDRGSTTPEPPQTRSPTTRRWEDRHKADDRRRVARDSLGDHSAYERDRITAIKLLAELGPGDPVADDDIYPASVTKLSPREQADLKTSSPTGTGGVYLFAPVPLPFGRRSLGTTV